MCCNGDIFCVAAWEWNFVTASPCSPFCHLHTNFHAVTVKWTTVKSASLAGRRDTA